MSTGSRTDSEKETTEIVRRLDEIEHIISEDIDAELGSARDIKNQVNRLENNIKKPDNHLENNENVTHDRKVGEMVNDVRGDITALENKLGDLHESRQQVESALSQIRNIRDALASVVEGELDTKIVKEFQNRRDKLENSLMWWKGWTVISVILLFFSSVFLYFDIDASDSLGSATISKILLLLPVFVVVWFSFHQYNRHKRLIEQYEFKTSMADSLMGFREILRQDFSDEDQERVGEFVMQSVEKLYSDPQYNSNVDRSANEATGSKIPESNLDILRKLNEL